MRKIDAQITPTPSGRSQCLREASCLAWCSTRRHQTCWGSPLRSWLAISPLLPSTRRRSSQVPLRKRAFHTFAHGDFSKDTLSCRGRVKEARTFARWSGKIFSSSAQQNAGRRPIGSTAPVFSPISLVVMSAAVFFVLLVSFPGRSRCSRHLDGLPSMRTIERHLGIHQSIMKTHVHGKLSTHAYMQPRLCNLHKHLYFFPWIVRKKVKEEQERKIEKHSASEELIC